MDTDGLFTIITGGIIIILTIIEKCEKIKWRPLTWLFGGFTAKKQIEELTIQIRKMNDNLVFINDRECEHYKKQAKMFISDFAKDLRDARLANKDLAKVKSKGQYCSIIDLCDEYLDRKWNSEVKHDAEFIKEIFDNIKDEI